MKSQRYNKNEKGKDVDEWVMKMLTIKHRDATLAIMVNVFWIPGVSKERMELLASDGDLQASMWKWAG